MLRPTSVGARSGCRDLSIPHSQRANCGHLGFIATHRLVDIFAVGDRVMVLKRGENVGDRYVKDTDEHEVLEIIVSGTRESRLSADEALKRAA